MGKLARSAFTVGFMVALASGAFAGDPPAVTSCGQTLQGKFRLIADLDCSSYPDAALTLDGTLYLNGFTLTGNPSLASAQFERNSVISCGKACTVVGPGTVTGSVYGIVAYVAPVPPKKPAGTLKLDSVTVSNQSSSCVFGGRKIKASNVTISACGLYGAETPGGSISLVGSSISGAGSNFTALGFHPGAIDGQTRKAVVKDSQLTTNFGPGIGRVNASSVDRAHVVSLSNTTISDNGKHGVLAAVLSAKESTIENNCTSAGGPTCADIESCAKPKLKNTTCGTSQDCGADMTWSVCSGD